MNKLINALVAIVLIAGLGVLLYPAVSNQINLYQSGKRILAYGQSADALDPADYRQMLDEARAYNESLKEVVLRDAFASAAQETDESYQRLLRLTDDGIMGVIEIPKIGVRLPIYHTTSDYGLERGVGHMEGTSLPVGGESAHCALSGHRGLPSARLFSDLDQLVEGDLFYITVLNELLVYEVDQILTVLPYELEHVAAVEGEDLVTLVTCTPYGINTHRLLVRGRRVAPEKLSELLATGDSVRTVPMWQSVLFCAIPFAAVGLLLMLLIRPKRRFK